MTKETELRELKELILNSGIHISIAEKLAKKIKDYITKNYVKKEKLEKGDNNG